MSDYNLEQPHALPHVPTETVYICPAQSELAASACCAAPLSGQWRNSGDLICCGTLRIAVLDIDTQPSDEFKKKLGAWMCRALNEAQHNEEAQRPAGK